MRTFFGILAFVVAYLVLFLGGGMMVLFGFIEWNITAGKRSVEFASPGDGCDADRLELNVEDGTPLFCTTGVAVGPGEHRGLEGFSEAQNAEVFTLAARLGEDGLSEDDQQRIEDRVDAIAETLPPVEDEQVIPGPDGIHRILLGAAMLGSLGLWRFADRAR